jgi:soluble lytic murein transglycosylase
MRINRPRLLLVVCGVAGLIAFFPGGRRPPAELAAVDGNSVAPTAPVGVPRSREASDPGLQAKFESLAARPTAADGPTGEAALSATAALHAPRPEARMSGEERPGEFDYTDADEPPRGLGLNPPASPRAEPAPVFASPQETAASADAKVQLAYASPQGAAPAIAALPDLASPAPESPAPAPTAADSAPRLPPPSPVSSEAVILYNRGDVAGLAALARAANDGARRLALEWASLRADPHPSFVALAAFLAAHPDWPSRVFIRDRQEAELAAHPQAPANVAEFFAAGAPQTAAGKIAAARAARAMGRSEEATRIIRALWRDGNFDALTEAIILRDFGASLAKADQKYRADRLVYAGYPGPAARAAGLAGPEVLALEEARVQAARAPMSAALVRAVPPALRNDPGLLFSRVQYARRAGRVYEAAVLLSLAPHDRDALVSPDRWWSERKMVAAALLDLDEPRLAFEVCDGTVRPETAEDEVDAEFHAGWIALRFLNDPSRAAARFALAAAAADAPLSIARAAYWQGRAAEAVGGSKDAEGFYERAAGEPIAYYGQLAAKRLGLTRLALRTPKAAAEGERRNEAVSAVAALYREGLDNLAASLAFDAARQWQDESQIAAMAEVVRRFGDAGTQVQFGKFALIRGYPLDATAFPDSGMPAFLPLAHSADLPTVYAVARQESEFVWHSSSWAGAKGLMQMLPSTAALTARQAGVEFDYARLIADPAFNTRLGAVLLGQLIADEGGSRELAFAAYNAGPGRVTQWIAEHGDPRNGTADLIDWIERIPFDETRDYVQRVSENLGVYRQRFIDDPPRPAPVSARMARE